MCLKSVLIEKNSCSSELCVDSLIPWYMLFVCCMGHHVEEDYMQIWAYCTVRFVPVSTLFMLRMEQAALSDPYTTAVL